MKSSVRKLELFRYIIQFLEIYGTENFGQSAEIDWTRVWDFCSKCGILDFNDEVEKLVHDTKDEEFSDKVFAFLEKQAVEGYPLWRLFKMSDWLYNQCEAQLIAQEHAKDLEYFNSTKCYRCKNFKNKLHIIYATLIEPLAMGNFESIEDFRNKFPNAAIKFCTHEMTCMERERQLEEAYQNLCGKNLEYFKDNRDRFNQVYSFNYKKFNYRDGSQDNRSKEWVLYPLALKRCNYFVESDMTPEKFEKLWNEIPRRKK